jgi:cytochrome c
MKRVTLLVIVAVIAVAFVAAYGQKEEKAEKVMRPEEAMKASVMNGKALFGDAGLGTNGKTCNDCHTAGGTAEGKMGKMVIRPFDEVNEKYPMYWMMADKVMTLDQVINWCIMTPLEGKPLEWDDQRLADLAAYCSSIKSPETETEDEEDDY